MRLIPDTQLLNINACHTLQIGVASTKAYTSQVLVMTMMALMLGEDSVSKSTKRESIIKELEWLPDRWGGLNFIHDDCAEW